MRPSDTEEPSRIIGIYEQLRKLHPNWYVEFGKRAGGGWIPGKELQEPDIGAFNALLARIGQRLKTSDRKIIAASFALRFGWSAGAAVAPFLLHQCVPDIGLENVSLKFNDFTLFEKVSMHEARGHLREGKYCRSGVFV
jgi:hypothetical protein